MIVLRSQRTVKKTGVSTTESRYYLSSALPQAYCPGQWLDLIRGHWGGIEVRNHWRRDVVMGEDRSRSRNAHLLANLALIRNALLAILPEHIDAPTLPELRERLHSRPSRCYAILRDL
ncbi:MAG: DDE transposase family protein [Verrucomicrobia bacterium]|nr:MAG: DDE transposase family protein [Verrucomicrobiota bacterium]